ncbi:MAG TPA: hypothetical protein VFJ19_15200 [Nocardioidaceae bacterium]|nr:hypothetical protein [Nocardioidaceae bacterium]
MASEQMRCPECGEPVPVTPGFVTWCPACDWGLDLDLRAEEAGVRARWWSRIVTRLAQTAHDPAQRRDGRAFSAQLLFATGLLLALLAPAVSIVLAVGGIALIVTNTAYPMIVGVGVVLVLLAIVFRPRLPRLGGEQLSWREDSPFARSLRAAAQQVGRPLPRRVRMLPLAATTVLTTSFAGRRELLLDPVVWTVLSGGAREAVLTRALARETRPARACQVIAAVAFGTTVHWLSLAGGSGTTAYAEADTALAARDPLVYYESAAAYSRARRQRWVQGFARFTEVVLVAVVRVYLRPLTLCLLPSWHRGDYGADAAAAGVTSGSALREALEAELLAEPLLRIAARPLGPDETRTRLEVVRDHRAATPDSEVERLRRLDVARIGSGQVLVAPNLWRARRLAGNQVQSAAAPAKRDMAADRDPEIERCLEQILERLRSR